ncbi:MAG: GNAT family N-acetyltransferase [Bacteroidota bacterium]|uniref:GNAT family N-acetyltransferase n=1 Tax=Flagellimonas okinawensis TaxID=3031324 RepID=A0ABT5XJT9_9FLAO|nr:GNAT family N-acetyltransferase [[Muricauda] okinawensis]MDF0706153.1 GNAT family N-acetyltransferase [[Muricauda] okinawensis]MEC8832879.1 GNAT family N-acetyltransferase [Bacteroidota bacterium]
MDIHCTIVPYSEIYKEDFRKLNEEWIIKYFELEDMDRKVLQHPKEYILDKGGYIAVALLDQEPVGVCALIPCKYEGYDFELSKMGVSPKVQGKGIGKLLGMHIIEKARQMGAKKLFLESNRILGPALSLYKRLGFKEITKIPSPYTRSDIQMELTISDV